MGKSTLGAKRTHIVKNCGSSYIPLDKMWKRIMENEKYGRAYDKTQDVIDMCLVRDGRGIKIEVRMNKQ